MGLSGLGSSGWLRIRAIGGSSSTVSWTVEHRMVRGTWPTTDLFVLQEGLCFMWYVTFLSPIEFLEHFNVMSVNLHENIHMLIFLSLRMCEVQGAQSIYIFFMIPKRRIILRFVLMKEWKDSSSVRLVQPVSRITLWNTSGFVIALGMSIVQLDPALVEWLIT
jgi:hypothetical protein